MIKKFSELNLRKDLKKNFSFEELCEKLKNGGFKKICFITGAGISVSAGIPDFRSKGGLYEELGKKYGKSEPEELMTLDFFMDHPECLYSIMKTFLQAEIKPTLAHKFFAKLANSGVVAKYFTQNIDGLEQEAGLKENVLLQAHGHCRTA